MQEYDKKFQFIACQGFIRIIVKRCSINYVFTATIIHTCLFLGPLTKTVVDHWRMIWQEKAHTIVMVTNIKEAKKTKCQQYWPDSDSKEFGQFRITLADQQIFADYTIRLLQVEVSRTVAC